MADRDQFAPDLLLTLDRARGRGLRAQLEGQLRDGVRAGRLREGTTLPSSRALARDLGVSRGVVVEAYAQLVAEGFLRTRPGGQTTVGPVAAQSVPARAEVRDPPGPRWDLRVETGDLAAFPRRAWLAAQRRVLAEASDAALGYGDRSGVPALRSALASYLGRARGVVAEPDNVVITVGIMQAMGLLAAVLRDRGVRRVAVEDPGFVFHHQVLRRAGIEVLRVPVDEGRSGRCGCRDGRRGGARDARPSVPHRRGARSGAAGRPAGLGRRGGRVRARGRLRRGVPSRS